MLVLRGDRLLVSVLPLLIAAVFDVVTTLLVTREGVEEKTEGQRSEGTLVSGIQALLRGSERQLLKRGLGGFGVLPGSRLCCFYILGVKWKMEIGTVDIIELAGELELNWKNWILEEGDRNERQNHRM